MRLGRETELALKGVGQVLHLRQIAALVVGQYLGEHLYIEERLPLLFALYLGCGSVRDVSAQVGERDLFGVSATGGDPELARSRGQVEKTMCLLGGADRSSQIL